MTKDSSSPSFPIEAGDAGIRLAVRIQPGGSRDAVEGVKEGRLRVRVQAPPVEGAANKALLRLLSKTFGVSKSKVTIVRGDKSREKTVEVAGVNGEDARSLLEGALASPRSGKKKKI